MQHHLTCNGCWFLYASFVHIFCFKVLAHVEPLFFFHKNRLANTFSSAGLPIINSTRTNARDRSSIVIDKLILHPLASSVQLSSVQTFRRAREIPCALHPISRKLSHGCLPGSCSVGLTATLSNPWNGDRRALPLYTSLSTW